MRETQGERGEKARETPEAGGSQERETPGAAGARARIAADSVDAFDPKGAVR